MAIGPGVVAPAGIYSRFSKNYKWICRMLHSMPGAFPCIHQGRSHSVHTSIPGDHNRQSPVTMIPLKEQKKPAVLLPAFVLKPSV
jgi:hypothetical protein